MSGEPPDSYPHSHPYSHPHSPDLERLSALGAPGGPEPDEALRLFARLRATPDEHRAIDWLVTRHARAPLPGGLLVAVAAALVDRGDADGASRVLSSATTSPALMLRAELAAQSGELEAALTLIERVLARDIDWPGARERHARWEGALGTATLLRPGKTHGTARTSSELDAADPLAAAVSAIGSNDAIGPFEPVREIGRGGAGAVYEARERALGRTVALKIYHRPDRDRAQLLHEARVACAVAGPGVVRIFDVDPQRGWLVMQWARGGALGARLRSGDARAPAPAFPDAPLAWAAPLARALARIHAAGWVHHDVKPANVVLCGPDAPLLVDFGAARRIGEPSPPGSPGYVSPERAAGRPSDPRDDVYGFGRVLQDALDAPGRLDGPRWGEAEEPWRNLAAACTGPDAGRPRDGGELVALAGAWAAAAGKGAAGDCPV